MTLYASEALEQIEQALDNCPFPIGSELTEIVACWTGDNTIPSDALGACIDDIIDAIDTLEQIDLSGLPDMDEEKADKEIDSMTSEIDSAVSCLEKVKDLLQHHYIC